MANIVEIKNPEGPVATVILNRPDKKNAWTLELFDALSAAAAQLAKQGDLRAVVIHGAGSCFSAGLDFSVFGEFTAAPQDFKVQMLNPPAGQQANRFQAPVVCWQKLPVPVIAAIEGVCFGAGMQLALAADFRVAAPDAQFSIMEAKWGLIPDMGISQSLPRLLSADNAKDLIMTGRIVGAAEALSMGLITQIKKDAPAAARDFAANLASRSPDAVKAAKQLVDACWSDNKNGLALEAELQADLIGNSNQMETVAANLQNRKPQYN